MHVRIAYLAAAGLALAACGTTRSSSEQPTARAPDAERGERTGASDETVDQDRASEQAISTRPTESVGQNPHPLPGADVTGDRLEGRVAFVDGANREIAIDAGTATTQVQVAEDAKITVDGRRGTLEDLRQGAEVRVSLDKSGDMPQATEIEVVKE
jgi:hypothetical protein